MERVCREKRDWKGSTVYSLLVNPCAVLSKILRKEKRFGGKERMNLLFLEIVMCLC